MSLVMIYLVWSESVLTGNENGRENPRVKQHGFLRSDRRRAGRIDGDLPHLVPGTLHRIVGCQCEVHGLKSGVGRAMGSIMGEVYLSGDCLEHSLGFRAQYAYPKILLWFKYTDCHIGYGINDLRVLRKESPSPQTPIISGVIPGVIQVCAFCSSRHSCDQNANWIPLSYVIEKLEYEYDLEVG